MRASTSHTMDRPHKGRASGKSAGGRCMFLLGMLAGILASAVFLLSMGTVRNASFDLVLGSGRPQALKVVCTDTCVHAKDGVCNEGRWPDGVAGLLNHSAGQRLAEHQVLCDFGTDCSDCGEFYGPTVTTSWRDDLGGGPIGFSANRSVQVYVQTLTTKPPIIFHYTNWTQDDDVSLYVHHMHTLEGGITQVFREVLQSRCVRSDGSRALVLDIGANFGYFSVYAAMMGCRVVAWEPIPRFRAFFERSVIANNVSHLVEIRTTAVSLDNKGQEVQLKAPYSGNWGTASIGGMNTYAEKFEWVTTHTEAVDDVVAEHVLLLKIDVEGHEASAMESAAGLMSKHGVDNIIMEYNPQIKEQDQDLDGIRRNVAMMKSLVKDYNVAHLHDVFAKGACRDGDVGALPEVSQDMLQYDVEDQRRGCRSSTNITQDLARKYESWGYWMSRACMHRNPAFAHPKSFRASFYGNTNIWVQRRDFGEEASGEAGHILGKMKLNGTAAPMALTQDARTTWFATNIPGMGLGHLSCAGTVAPVNHIIWRCPCTNEQVCGAEQKDILDLLKQGKLDFLYDIP